MVHISRDADVPLHFEASPLTGRVATVGWPAAVVAIGTGIAAFVRAGPGAGEAASALLVVVGSVLVVCLVRCRRYEITVGKRMTELRLGPFRRTIPTGSVTGAQRRPASSWRRFYAPSELLLSLDVDTRTVAVPTRDPDGLRSTLVGDQRQDEDPV